MHVSETMTEMILKSTTSYHTHLERQIHDTDFAYANATKLYTILPNLRPYICSIGSSGNSSSTSLTTHLFKGGLTNPLNKNVPYTNAAKPTTCSHLNVSHPKNNETIQMNNVRQVSMVDRAVAETVRVTESPKKLKPL